MNMDILPRWFLEGSAVLGGLYFLWSMRKTLADFKTEVSELKDLIGKLFDQDAKYEKRISRIEGRCAAMPCLQPDPGGRRPYDPKERVDA